MQTGQLFFTAAHADYTVFLKLKLGQITSSHTGNNVNFVPFFFKSRHFPMLQKQTLTMHFYLSTP